MPKCSIITINYNNKPGLEKTIRSVAEQTFQDFEYIIIDGGSTDGSKQVMDAFRNKISYSVSEPDKGIYNAQNKGISVAKGDYLLFLNSGDFLVNNDVLKKVFSTEHTEDILYGNMRINWGGGSISEGKMPQVISSEHMFNDTLWHPVSFIRRSLFDKFGLYNENYKIVADYDFFFRAIIKNKVSTKHLGMVISEYDTSGLSSKPEHKELEKNERRRVQETYLSEDEIRILEKEQKRKNGLFYGLLRKFKLKK
jgi:glycosyltransferase involved in cell wall biosynthesis